MQTIPATTLLPPRTLIGSGRIKGLLQECGAFGQRGVLVHGKSLLTSGALDLIRANKPAEMALTTCEHEGGEPTLDQLRAVLKAARECGAEWIAAVGGGSVLDLGKACAGLFNTGADVAAYHDCKAIEKPGIPFVAAPTTAGTGSEATPNSVLTNSEKQSKKSIRDDSFMARLVILDAGLLAACPRNVIAWSGMDALTQAIEAFTSNKTTWLSDQFSLKGLTLIAQNLLPVFETPSSDKAEDLLLGSYLTGVGLSMARLGVIHGLAHPLGVMYNQPHGLVCAVCLPHALEFNRDAIGAKYAAMSAAIGCDLLNVVRDLSRRLGVSSPFKDKAIVNRDAIVSETLASGSTAANPREVAATDVNWLLARLF